MIEIENTLSGTRYQFSNKTRLGQLRRIIGMRVETALTRRRKAENVLKESIRVKNSKGLERGQGDQLTLNFNKVPNTKVDVVVKTTTPTTEGYGSDSDLD